MSIFIPKNIKFILIKNKNKKNIGLVLYTKDNFMILRFNSIKILEPSNTLALNYLNFLGKTVSPNYLTNYIYMWDFFFFKKN